jgi:hypothetical protein
MVGNLLKRVAAQRHPSVEFEDFFPQKAPVESFSDSQGSVDVFRNCFPSMLILITYYNAIIYYTKEKNKAPEDMVSKKKRVK